MPKGGGGIQGPQADRTGQGGGGEGTRRGRAQHGRHRREARDRQGKCPPSAQSEGGIDHTKAHYDAYRGRKPNLIREQSDAVSGALGQGRGMSSIAAATGLTRQTIYRIKENTAEAEAALARWS